MSPRKNAEIIKAWADGAEIQWRLRGSQCPWNSYHHQHEQTPSFLSDDLEFRIKPTPPEEPNYGEIAQTAVWDVPKAASEKRWDRAANAVIEAYKNHQQALKEYNES